MFYENEAIYNEDQYADLFTADLKKKSNFFYIKKNFYKKLFFL